MPARTVQELHKEIVALRSEMSELTTRIDRLRLIVCGDGINGLNERVAELERIVQRGNESLLVRLTRLEHKIGVMDYLLKIVLTTAVTTLVTAVLQVVLR